MSHYEPVYETFLLMSFLLDALGKADHDRRRAEVPELRTYRTGSRSTLRRVSGALLLLGLIGVAFVLGYLLRPVLEPALFVGRSDVEVSVAPVAASAIEPVMPVEPILEVESIPLKQEINLPVLEVISFSNKPAGRFVMIDGTLLYEGDALQSGETLLSIEKDAVVIDRKGEQIRLRM